MTKPVINGFHQQQVKTPQATNKKVIEKKVEKVTTDKFNLPEKWLKQFTHKKPLRERILRQRKPTNLEEARRLYKLFSFYAAAGDPKFIVKAFNFINEAIAICPKYEQTLKAREVFNKTNKDVLKDNIDKLLESCDLSNIDFHYSGCSCCLIPLQSALEKLGVILFLDDTNEKAINLKLQILHLLEKNSSDLQKIEYREQYGLFLIDAIKKNYFNLSQIEDGAILFLKTGIKVYKLSLKNQAYTLAHSLMSYVCAKRARFSLGPEDLFVRVIYFQVKLAILENNPANYLSKLKELKGRIEHVQKHSKLPRYKKSLKIVNKALKLSEKSNTITSNFKISSFEDLGCKDVFERKRDTRSSIEVNIEEILKSINQKESHLEMFIEATTAVEKIKDLGFFRKQLYMGKLYLLQAKSGPSTKKVGYLIEAVRNFEEFLEKAPNKRDREFAESLISIAKGLMKIALKKKSL